MSVALVTGASRGIGKAIALRLADEGHDIAIGYANRGTDAGRVAEDVRAAGARATSIGCDLEQLHAPDELVASVEADLGPVEILIANAGITSPPAAIAEILDEQWERVMSINLRAPFQLARRVVPTMIERGFGRIVFISSIAAYTGGIVGPHYAASKAALHGLARSLAQQTASRGVTVNVVAPALVDTEMIPADPAVRDQLVGLAPVGRLGTPEEIADMIAAVVRNGYLTGKSILLDGGWHAT
jgi:3-oxoacyl-[acyl-carrier protein] reductase